MSTNKHCEKCGKQYFSPEKHALVCAQVQPRTCKREGCGGKFVPKQPTQAFCNPKCRNRNTYVPPSPQATLEQQMEALRVEEARLRLECELTAKRVECSTGYDNFLICLGVAA